MKIHHEGRMIIAIAFVAIALLCLLLTWLTWSWPIVWGILNAAGLIFFILIVRFFRVPTRNPQVSGKQLVCPADGKVVAIEEVEEGEFYKDKRIQLSVFMSPLNVHVNYYPITGKVTYSKYHPGKYLVAFHPKSSTENERTSIVVENEHGSVLFRQIAGAVARRICNYAEVDNEAAAGTEFGFIKFGSRIDLLLPLDADIKVHLNQKVTGAETIIAEFS